jgi:hypothetical protein
MFHAQSARERFIIRMGGKPASEQCGTENQGRNRLWHEASSTHNIDS